MYRTALAATLLTSTSVCAYDPSLRMYENGLWGGGSMGGNLDLNGFSLYGQGIDELTGVLHYYSSTKMWLLGVRDNASPRMLSIGVCELSTGCTSDYNSVSGFQILGQGDVGGTGSSANLWNLNTVDSANNDHTMMLGGGATNKRGSAFQFYNNGRFAGATYDMAASSNEQGLVHFSSGVNQTGTAGYRLLWGEVHETSTGSGVHLLLDLGINSGGPGNMVGVNVNNGTDIAGYTSKFNIDSSGNTALAGTLTSSRTSDLGWSVQTSANQACNTTCTSACAGGQDTDAATKPIVACSDASADRCFCAGAN